LFYIRHSIESGAVVLNLKVKHVM